MKVVEVIKEGFQQNETNLDIEKLLVQPGEMVSYTKHLGIARRMVHLTGSSFLRDHFQICIEKISSPSRTTKAVFLKTTFSNPAPHLRGTCSISSTNEISTVCRRHSEKPAAEMKRSSTADPQIYLDELEK